MLRGVCNERLKIDIEYSLKRGTTDNSYIVEDGKDNILIDVPDENFTDDHVATLEQTIPLQSLRRIVLTHLTPKRLPSLRALLERKKAAGGALDVHLSNPALQLLRSSLGGDKEGAALLSSVELVAARSGGSLEVGQETVLKLIPCPTPRWPDLLVAYSPGDRLLFTSKLFSAHVSPDKAGEARGEVTDKLGWDAYRNDWRNFFDCMLAPVAQQAAGALEKLDVVAAPSTQSSSPLQAVLEALRATQAMLESSQTARFGAKNMGVRSTGVGMVAAALCPMHGPVVRASVTELVGQYRQWTSAQIAAAEQASVAVLYASAYGNTAALAQAISRGITKAGVGVNTLNLEVVPLDEVSRAISKSGGFVIGSPTLGGHMPTQVQTALGAVLRDASAKELPCGVFGSFGWSGEAVDELESRLRDAGFQQAFGAIRVKFKPTARDMQVAEESGTDLAQRVLKNLKMAQRKAQAGASAVRAGRASGMEQAVGRLLGSLCAITARDDDAQSAMLASWISQASFDPPGLSVAVKKDRAAEGLLATGSKFVVNILADGREKPVIKQLLKQFKPGEDRFAGLDTQVSEATGCIILPGTAAYLECTVADKLEAGDHWVVYATVDAGQVTDEGALSAVHHRKIGTTY
ncbi:g3445 [Coccomyxa elongata]